MSWKDDLQPASFRGIEFGVTSATVRTGRRTALHEYPQRDTVYVEDIGGGTNVYTFSGYVNLNRDGYGSLAGLGAIGDRINQLTSLSRFGGGDSSRDGLLKALQEPGGGTLVHPSLGSKYVALTSCVLGEFVGGGGLVTLQLEFVETTQKQFPGVANAASEILGAADQSILSTVSTFARNVRQVVGRVTAVIQRVKLTVRTILSTGRSVVQSVRNLISAVRGIVPSVSNGLTTLMSFGRFSFGSRKSTQAGVTTTRAAIAQQSETARAYTVKRDALLADPVTDIETFGGSVASVVAAIATLNPDPIETIRTYAEIAATTVTATDEASVATCDLISRIACIEMCRAVGEVYFASSDDAATVLGIVQPVIDDAITRAGDRSEDDVYRDLRVLRAAVVRDIVRRGTDRAPLQEVTTPEPLPAPVLAQMLYLDGTRADELVERSDVRHPAFMPTSFKALAR